MKYLMLTFVSFLFAGLLAAQSDAHIGTWEGDDGSEVGSFTFDSEGYAYFQVEGESLGGPSYDMDGMDVSLTYKIDYSKTPYCIDFIITMLEDNSTFEMMKGIFVFQEDNSKMKICLNMEGETRPTEFVEEDTIILTKTK